MAKDEKRKSYTEYARDISKMFIEEMKRNVMPWQMDWETYGVSQLPRSAVSNKLYQGMNQLLLRWQQKENGYKDPRWLTQRQAQDLGGYVKYNELGTEWIYWAWVKELTPSKEGESKPKPIQQNGKQTGKENGGQWISRWIPCRFVVFNVEQCEGLNLNPYEAKKHDWKPIEEVEKLIAATGAVIRHEISEDVDKSTGFWTQIYFSWTVKNKKDSGFQNKKFWLSNETPHNRHPLAGVAKRG